jgi:hypothetical protein
LSPISAGAKVQSSISLLFLTEKLNQHDFDAQ